MIEHSTLEIDNAREAQKPVGESILESQTGIPTQILSLIAGEGDLRETLSNIVEEVSDESAISGCFLCWRGDREKTVSSVSSSKTDPLLLDRLHALAIGGFNFLTEHVEDAIASLGVGQMAVQPIIGARGETLGLLILLGNSHEEVGELGSETSVKSLVAMAGFAILSESRTQAFGEANERFAALAKNIPGVVYQRVVGANGDICYSYISDAAEDLFGVTPDEILSNPQALFDCHGPEYYATFRDRLLEASKALELWDVEATIYTRDGKRKFTHALARPHREMDGSVVWNGVILDQTRIKEAEMATAAAEASTRDAIIESIPQAFALFDKDDRLVTWNSRFIKLYPELKGDLAPGASYADLVKAEIKTGIDAVPEDADPQAHFYQRLARHHLANYEAERQATNSRWILINEHRTADGGTVVLHTDVTELKKREFALEQSNRELEAFASIASHDLQEPLRKIDAFGGRLSKKFANELGDDGRMYIDRMQSSVARMRELINDLLDYSRITTQAKPLVQVDLEQIANDVVGDLQILLEMNDGRVDISDLPVVDADKTQMRQLFQNIIANGLKFHRTNIAPIITVTTVGRDKADQPDETTTVSISDNGIGFEMKYADRIFGIFQRLHGRSEYDGTGVGLATCRKIVDHHGWKIRVESELGTGTTFYIDIPCVKQIVSE